MAEQYRATNKADNLCHVSKTHKKEDKNAIKIHANRGVSLINGSYVIIRILIRIKSGGKIRLYVCAGFKNRVFKNEIDVVLKKIDNVAYRSHRLRARVWEREKRLSPAYLTRVIFLYICLHRRPSFGRPNKLVPLHVRWRSSARLVLRRL